MEVKSRPNVDETLARLEVILRRVAEEVNRTPREELIARGERLVRERVQQQRFVEFVHH